MCITHFEDMFCCLCNLHLYSLRHGPTACFVKKKRSSNDLDHVDQTCRHTGRNNVMNDSVFIEEMGTKTRCLTKV